MTTSLREEIHERLKDVNYRLEYGSINVKYDLAHALVEARRLAGLTQKELADIAEVSQPYIAKLESGEANPSIGRIGALLAAIWLRTRFNLEPLVTTIEQGEAVIHQKPMPSTYEDLIIDSQARTVSGSDATDAAYIRSPDIATLERQRW